MQLSPAAADDANRLLETLRRASRHGDAVETIGGAQANANGWNKLSGEPNFRQLEPNQRMAQAACIAPTSGLNTEWMREQQADIHCPKGGRVV